MKKHIFKFWIFVWLIAGNVFALEKEESSLSTTENQEDNLQSSFFAKKEKVFTPLVADPWETQCSIYALNNHEWLGRIGTDMPLYQTQVWTPALFRLDLSLMTFNWIRFRKEEGGGFDLDSSDTKFGLIGNYKMENLHARLGLHHISSHLADGQLWPQQKKKKQGYSREFLQFNVSYELPYATPYLGTHYVFTQRHPKEYEGKSFLIFQWGGQVHHPLSEKTSLFLAADWQSREEYSYFINQSYEAGIQFQGAFHDPARILWHYYTGYDPRGEYFNSKKSFWGFGIQQFL